MFTKKLEQTLAFIQKWLKTRLFELWNEWWQWVLELWLLDKLVSTISSLVNSHLDQFGVLSEAWKSKYVVFFLLHSPPLQDAELNLALKLMNLATEAEKGNEWFLDKNGCLQLKVNDKMHSIEWIGTWMSWGWQNKLWSYTRWKHWSD